MKRNNYPDITDFFYNISLPLLITFILIALYRILTFCHIRNIYQTFSGLGIFRYLSCSSRTDITVIMILLILFTGISLILKRFRTSQNITLTVLLSILNVFFIGASNFFRVYETPLSRSFWSDEISTGLAEIIRSTAAETPPWIFICAAAGIILIILIMYRYSRLKIPALLILSIPLIIIIQLIFFTLSFTSTGYIAKDENLLKELSSNPLLNIFIKNNIQPDAGRSSHETVSNALTLDTGSILQKKIYDRINNIPRGTRYNIIFYFFESTPMKYYDIEINGRKVLPNWHRLMENSFFASNHYANYPLSANAMLSVMTSAYSHYSKDLVIQKYSCIKLDSLPEILKRDGYRTCVLHTGDLRYAGQRRFLGYRKIERMIDLPELEHIPPYNYKVGWGLDERSMTEPAVRFIKEKKDIPFFMALFPANPHHPYAIPDGFERITGPIPSSIDYREKNWLNYINSLHFADYCLGEFVDRLEKEGLMENTILFLFADHGEAFYQHRQNYNHPFFLYEENIHVPMLIYNKKFFREKTDFTGISRHIDIPVTVLDILNLKKNDTHEGISLLSRHREQLAFLHTYWKDDYCGIRDGKWKYIRKMSDGREELYDLDSDPGEIRDLSADLPEISEKFRKFIITARVHQVQFYKKFGAVSR